MRLKRIKLSNIRSYESNEIEFPEGSTLLSGDIGSGKTSILLAIEFGLFGLQPGQKGTSLLRNGAKEGGVEIEFEVDGKNVFIERKLKRGKSISQDTCYAIIDGDKKEISVMELKALVLDLLNYPKEFSKKQNMLYKFTVYTPQEEMKQIIQQDSETRTNTLRHVFGIDKYKKVLENTSILLSKLREEKRGKEGLTANLESDKSELLIKENELETKQYNLVSFEKDLFEKSEKRKIIQEEKDELSKKQEEKIKFKQEIEKLNLTISHKKDSISNNQRTIEQLRSQLNELQNIQFDEIKISENQNKIEALKKERQELSDKNLELSSQISSLNMKIQENESLKSKIAHLETCPTCLQNVDEGYKNNMLERANREISESKERIETLNSEKKTFQEKISEIDSKISEIEKEINELNMLKVKLESINDKRKRIEEIQQNNSLMEKEIESINLQVYNHENSLAELSRYDSLFDEKQKELDDALKEEKQVEIKTAELRREIQVFSSTIEDLKSRIEKTEEIKRQLNYLQELENWLSQKFVPLISTVEKNVMLKLKKEFSELFSEWFSMLVSEIFHVRLDDNFTPIIEQQDYELDYSYLSGGERTAVALAYRLALNQVINSMLSKIKTKDLVILDEPTDGFSAPQLDKMRDVLNQLNVGQLIIVSHEQKMEGFVDNVIKLSKRDGVSQKLS